MTLPHLLASAEREGDQGWLILFPPQGFFRSRLIVVLSWWWKKYQL